MSDEFEIPMKKPKVEAPKETTSATVEKTEPNKPSYKPEELLRIFDEMIFSGTYTETVVIRNKLKVGLKTRTAEEIENITLALDASGANLISTLNEKRSLLNLHYAVVSYQGKDLSNLKQEDRVLFINRLPAPVIGVLIKELSKFDTKVYAACEEGEENF